MNKFHNSRMQQLYCRKVFGVNVFIDVKKKIKHSSIKSILRTYLLAKTPLMLPVLNFCYSKMNFI